jgi:hypothetical protein
MTYYGNEPRCKDGDELPEKKRKLHVITNSQVRTKRRCSREHYIAYELGFRPVVIDEALYFGDLIHVGLECYWKNYHDKAERLGKAIAAVQKKAKHEYDAAKATAMLIGYDTRWGNEKYEVLGVETVGRAPLVNPDNGKESKNYEIGFKLDVLVRDSRDGRTKFIEHKSSSHDIELGSAYWRRLVMDSQVSTYMMGTETTECIYDVLGKPALRPSSVPLVDEDGIKIVLDKSGTRVRTKDGKKWRQTASTEDGYELQSRPETPDEYLARLVEHIAENPGRYYQRNTIVRLENEREEAAKDLWDTVLHIAESRKSGRHPRNPDACERHNRLCAYFDVCTGMASLDDPTKFRKLENMHEELGEPNVD